MKELLKDWLRKAGPRLPHVVKMQLAQRSPKWGHLLRDDGDFIFDRYLGSYRVHINARHNVDREMLANHNEPSLHRLIRKQVSVGDVCLDVGANFGAITLELCRQVGESGRVIAFEPGPVFYRRLCSNLSLNKDLENIVQAYSVGLSNHAGEMFWAEDGEAPGNAGLLGTSGLAVPVTTLDLFAQAKNWDRVSFIKIDTEGMETAVLEGAQQIIARFRPKIVFETLMDFETILNRPVRKEAEALLKSFQYQIYEILEDGNVRKTAYPRFGLNSLALPSEKTV